MLRFTEFEVDQLACLHKQITEWVLCGHTPHHEDLAAAAIHALQTRDPELIRIVRSATAGRRQCLPIVARA